MPFEFEKTKLDGAVIVKPRVFPDSRGFAMESFKKSDFMKAGLPGDFVQDNHSRSSKGVLRGLHYQRGQAAQGKLVRCSVGAILDVGVDMRKGSPTFGQWIAVELSAANSLQLYLPPGFAHGFFGLTDTVEVQYKCTAEYSPKDEAGVRWDDPQLAIVWGVKDPILSDKDKAWPLFKDAQF